MENTFLGKTKTSGGDPKSFEQRVADYKTAVQRVHQQISHKLGRPIDPQKDVIVGFKTAVFRYKPGSHDAALTDLQQGILHSVIKDTFPTLQQETLMPDSKEAKYFFDGTYTGFLSQYPKAKGKKVVAIDLGSGSTEITAANKEEKPFLQSIEFGDGNHTLSTIEKEKPKGETLNAQELQKLRQGAKNAALKVLQKNKKLQKPDYLQYGFLQTQFQEYLAPYLKTNSQVDLFKQPVSKVILENLLKNDTALNQLKNDCEPHLQAYVKATGRGEEGERNNLQTLPKNLAIILGYMDALGVKQIYFADYGGVKSGYALEIAKQFAKLPNPKSN